MLPLTIQVSFRPIYISCLYEILFFFFFCFTHFRPDVDVEHSELPLQGWWSRNTEGVHHSNSLASGHCRLHGNGVSARDSLCISTNCSQDATFKVCSVIVSKMVRSTFSFLQVRKRIDRSWHVQVSRCSTQDYQNSPSAQILQTSAARVQGQSYSGGLFCLGNKCTQDT